MQPTLYRRNRTQMPCKRHSLLWSRSKLDRSSGQSDICCRWMALQAPRVVWGRLGASEVSEVLKDELTRFVAPHTAPYQGVRLVMGVLQQDSDRRAPQSHTFCERLRT